MGIPETSTQGRTVGDIIQHHRLPANLATYILVECAKALKEASEQGILHQNIRPNHILVSATGKVRLTKFTGEKGKTGSVPLLKSTLPYVAPECLSGASPSVSTDIFALGSSFFEVLTSDLAFKGTTGQEVKQKVMNYDPTPLLHEEDHVHTQLRRICQQMLRKKPQQRYQGYTVLLADLEAYRKNRGIEAVGSAVEMKRYLQSPDTYVSPERSNSGESRTRLRSNTENTTASAKTNANSTPKTKETQPQISKIFMWVGLLVLVFSGLSLAGNFFFSKDGKWGGKGTGTGASSSSSPTSATVKTRRGRGQGNAAVQASGSSDTSQRSGYAEVEGEAESVEIIDQSESNEEYLPESDTTQLRATSLAGVDTVIILPDEGTHRTGQLLIESDPEAFVFFQGDSLGVTPLPILTNPGTYTISLKAPAFPAFETIVDVVPDREIPVKVSLWILVGRLNLEVIPAAEVYIDDELREESLTKKSLPVLPGTRRLKVVHPELGTFESDIDIDAGDQKTVRFDLANMR
ncbi:MAG: protein kinase [Rhodothermaceae bacterium]|nr:protein kinase [Rhodothermaceae bacterium]